MSLAGDTNALSGFDGALSGCCCFCQFLPDLELSLAGLDANRCSGCIFVTGSAAVKTTGLAVDGTYTVPRIGGVTSSLLWTGSSAGAGYGHVQVWAWASGCVSLIEESDSAALSITIIIDCTDKDFAGRPRIKNVAVNVLFPPGFPSAIPGPTSVFQYTQFIDGGDYRVGDGQAIPNRQVGCDPSTLTFGGSAIVRSAA